jgi:hypothetical protein
MSAENILVTIPRDPERPDDPWPVWHSLMEEELVSPESAEFRDAFSASVMPGSDIVSLDGSLSALVVPDRQPTGYAVIDIDDVVADLSGSMRDLQHNDQKLPMHVIIIMITVRICGSMTANVNSKPIYTP